MIRIAIDGPGGAGKSTVAKAIAHDLGIIYLLCTEVFIFYTEAYDGRKK